MLKPKLKLTLAAELKGGLPALHRGQIFLLTKDTKEKIGLLYTHHITVFTNATVIQSTNGKTLFVSITHRHTEKQMRVVIQYSSPMDEPTLRTFAYSAGDAFEGVNAFTEIAKVIDTFFDVDKFGESLLLGD